MNVLFLALILCHTVLQVAAVEILGDVVPVRQVASVEILGDVLPEKGFANVLPERNSSISSQKGVNAEVCSFDNDCKKPRKCLSTNDQLTEFVSCDGKKTRCFCYPREPRATFCDAKQSKSQCDPRETCKYIPLGFSMCISTERLQKATSSQSMLNARLTGERCFTDNVCKKPRFCFVDKPGLLELCEFRFAQNLAHFGCKCRPIQMMKCKDKSGCPKGESCLNGICKLKKYTFSLPKSTSQLEDRVCIGMHHLKHIPEEELVFSKAHFATVLCDSSYSCATPGHIVIWNSQAMMMRRYCELTQCKQEQIQVNSPRWNMKRRIPTHTKGLEFSALAARYETSIEERIMRVAITVGA